MYHSSQVLERIAQDKMQDLQRQAAIERQLPSYRQRLAAILVTIAKWLEPELTERALTPRLLSR